MDIKSLTTQLMGKPQAEPNVIKPSVASSDHAPHSGTQLSPQTLKAIQTLLQGMQLGKIFDVIVTRVEGSTVSLQIPGASADTPVLQTEMKSPPPLGTRLTLQLTEETSKPELKVIAQPNSPQDVVSRNLRLGLQQQRAMTPLLANLALLAKSPDKIIADLPETVIETARQVVQQFSHAVQINTPQGLKQALQQTGPYLEATLARQTTPVDTKPAPPNTQITSQTTAGPVDATKPTSNAEKMARLELVTQTVQTMTRAMQQQPVQDVRANLLRLATIIRAVSEQQALQKNLGIEATDPDGIPIPQNARPAATPPPAALTDPKSASLADTTGTALTGKPASGASAQSPNPAPAAQIPTSIRSQTPQPQAAVQANLVTILDQQTALDELLGQVEGALARIQVQQLQTAATDQQHRPVWVMELPIKTEQGIDLFDLRIQRDTENHAGDDPKAPWTVSLAFDLEKLGPIRAQVSLYGEDRVSTVFWAEKHETSTYFNQHLGKLENRFRQVGLEVARVDCRCGRPDSPPPSSEPRLVDEKV